MIGIVRMKGAFIITLATAATIAIASITTVSAVTSSCSIIRCLLWFLRYLPTVVNSISIRSVNTNIPRIPFSFPILMQNISSYLA